MATQPRINEPLQSAIGADGVPFNVGDAVMVPLANGGPITGSVVSITEAQTRAGERWQCVFIRSMFGPLPHVNARTLRRIAREG